MITNLKESCLDQLPVWWVSTELTASTCRGREKATALLEWSSCCSLINLWFSCRSVRLLCGSVFTHCIVWLNWLIVGLSFAWDCLIHFFVRLFFCFFLQVFVSLCRYCLNFCCLSFHQVHLSWRRQSWEKKLSTRASRKIGCFISLLRASSMNQSLPLHTLTSVMAGSEFRREGVDQSSFEDSPFKLHGSPCICFLVFKNAAWVCVSWPLILTLSPFQLTSLSE